ncbi:unknown protein [Desulfotalea psychrophila LSv54]|uniref:Uncharacterized protein n=1 Tax=Desulfotalea psychrophila (strain LSv54 / DSM 12343) TaxID=177439 RepID=Q6APD7_DESPS|nr:unknown protein [Desulfotalea psychrophila LSv54]
MIYATRQLLTRKSKHHTNERLIHHWPKKIAVTTVSEEEITNDFFLLNLGWSNTISATG